MNPDLVRYCEEQLQAGFSKELLRAALVERGWGVREVEEVLHVLGMKLQNSAKRKKRESSVVGFRGAGDTVVKPVPILIVEEPATLETEAEMVPVKVEPLPQEEIVPVQVEKVVPSERLRLEAKGSQRFRLRFWWWIVICGLLAGIGWGLYQWMWWSPMQVLKRMVKVELAQPIESMRFNGLLRVDFTMDSVELPEGLWSGNGEVLGISYDPNIVGVDEQIDHVAGVLRFSGWSDRREGGKGDVSLNLEMIDGEGWEEGLRSLGLDVKWPSVDELMLRLRLEGDDKFYESFSGFLNRWVLIDLKELREAYQDSLDPYEVEMGAELSDKQKLALEETMMKSVWWKVEKVMEMEEIDGQKMFHYKMAIDQTGWRELYESVLVIVNGKPVTDEQRKLIEMISQKVVAPTAELWIGKDDNRLHRVVIDMSVEDGEARFSGDVHFEWSWWDVNQTFELEVPDSVTTWQELVEEINSRMVEPETTVSVEPEGLVFDDEVAARRDLQRESDVASLSAALSEFLEEKEDSGLSLAVGQKDSMRIGEGEGLLNLGQLLVPTYLSEIPMDPLFGSLKDTYYNVYLDSKGDVVVWGFGEIKGEITSRE